MLEMDNGVDDNDHHDQNPPVEEKKNTVNLDDDLLDEMK